MPFELGQQSFVLGGRLEGALVRKPLGNVATHWPRLLTIRARRAARVQRQAIGVDRLGEDCRVGRRFLATIEKLKAWTRILRTSERGCTPPSATSFLPHARRLPHSRPKTAPNYP
jgi:hypothetical protein